MSATRPVVRTLLFALPLVLIVMGIAAAAPADAQPRSLYGITPTAAEPTDTPVPPTDAPAPVAATNTPLPPPANTPKPPAPTSQPNAPAPAPTEAPVPLLPITGAEQPTNLLLPAMLILASLACVFAIRKAHQ